ncbi:MFS transporter [Halosquirtibacter xylanolyticus]|uniref:MFS transporter n=1 Tax=Halosquirtibacter xylanolyticus TaxID=3374599 RepID=UPI003748A2BC|nr:MFS transporter [Prolixibacteraceae bacterium]
MNRKIQFPINVSKYPFFYGWVIMIVGTFGMLGSIPGQPFGVSAFTDALMSVTHLTRNEISLYYLIGTLFSACCLPFVGIMYDRFGVRIVMLSATVGLALIQGILSYSEFVIQMLGGGTSIMIYMILVFFSIRLLGQGTMALVSRAMIMKWFDQKRGVANAVSGTMVSVGFSIAPSILLTLLYLYGWEKSYRILAISLMCLSVIIFFFYADTPEKYHLHPDGEAGSNVSKSLKGRTIKEALRTYPFWIICLVTGFCNFFIGGFTFHITSIAEEFQWSKDMVVNLFIYATAISVFCALLANIISDYVASKYVLAACVFGILIASIGLFMRGYAAYYWCLVVGIAIFSGSFTASAAVLHPRFFGRANLGQISGVNMTVMVVMSAIAPFIFSLCREDIGSYIWAGAICMVISLILLLGALFVRDPKR